MTNVTSVKDENAIHEKVEEVSEAVKEENSVKVDEETALSTSENKDAKTNVTFEKDGNATNEKVEDLSAAATKEIAVKLDEATALSTSENNDEMSHRPRAVVTLKIEENTVTIPRAQVAMMDKERALLKTYRETSDMLTDANKKLLERITRLTRELESAKTTCESCKRGLVLKKESTQPPNASFTDKLVGKFTIIDEGRVVPIHVPSIIQIQKSSAHSYTEHRLFRDNRVVNLDWTADGVWRNDMVTSVLIKPDGNELYHRCNPSSFDAPTHFYYKEPTKNQDSQHLTCRILINFGKLSSFEYKFVPANA